MVHARPMAVLQLDQDFRVGAGDVVRRDHSQVEGERHADHVVQGLDFGRPDDLADFRLNLEHPLFRGFQPGADRGSVMQLDDADIGGGEEIRASDGGDPEAGGEQAGEAEQHEAAGTQAEGEHVGVAMLEPVKPAFKQRDRPVRLGGFAMRVIAQHHPRHRRQDGEAEHVGGEHRQHHGDAERDEQEARRTGEQENREEDDANGEGGDGERGDHFAAAIENGHRERFAHRLVAVDVFDGDGGVVHQQADGQCQPAERHQIDRLPQGQQPGNAGKDGKRDGDGDDHHVSPRPEEDQDHQRDQDRRDNRLMHHVVDGGAHEDRLVEIQAHIEPVRRGGLDFRQGSTQRLHHHQG